jgi:hypothetical protein
MSPQTSAYTPKMNKCVIIFTKYTYIKELTYLDCTGWGNIHSFIHHLDLNKTQAATVTTRKLVPSLN